MKKASIYLLFLSLVAMSSCELINTDPPRDFVPDEADAEGNLLVINNSSERLVLYKDEYIVKKIPASATDYLVKVENPGEGTIELDLYRWDDVSADPNNPDPTKVYKKWLVPLAKSYSIEERATWHINGASQYVTTATINFSYYGGTDEFVDIYLNGRTGAKIMTMMPGQQYKKVGVDYGNYTLHYLYWFSDQNSTDGFEEKGWIETENINGEDKDIWLILNENRKDVTTIVPHLGSAQNNGTKYGNLTIKNYSGDPVQIYAGDKLIESICYLEDGSIKNLSTIDRNGIYTFVMPIYEEGALKTDYMLSAKHLTNGSTIESTVVTIGVDATTEWIVDGVADTTDTIDDGEEIPSDTTAVIL